MTSNRESDVYPPLAEHRTGSDGLHVKLDKGFEQGTYCIYVEFDGLAAQAGFGPAYRKAREYCGLLKEELGRGRGYALGKTEDASRMAEPGRKRDLESTFLSFPVETADGGFHDGAMKEQFRVGCLRVGQALEQKQARAQTARRNTRQEQFRDQLGELLRGKAYASLDPAVKERLLAEVVTLAFPARDVGR